MSPGGGGGDGGEAGGDGDRDGDSREDPPNDAGAPLRRRRVHVIVRGRVQGVAYRAYAADEASRLGVSGWVRNRDDGWVELEIEGDAGKVDEMVAWCRRGSPAARVTGVDLVEREAELDPRDGGPGGAGGFRVRG